MIVASLMSSRMKARMRAIAIKLVKREFVHVTAGTNYECLSKDEIDLELPLVEVNDSDLPSSSSTKSVDDTEVSSLRPVGGGEGSGGFDEPPHCLERSARWPTHK